jgi:hypothetical protein
VQELRFHGAATAEGPTLQSILGMEKHGATVLGRMKAVRWSGERTSCTAGGVAGRATLAAAAKVGKRRGGTGLCVLSLLVEATACSRLK